MIADRYELVSVIGRGGFGEVWLAHNRLLDNDVALKLYVGADEAAVVRLYTEARAAAALEHPAIVRVFDVGTTFAGDPFLVMELLHGENLEDVLGRTGPLSPRRALRVLLPIIDGIACAHVKGLVHRDIKLANIVLTNEGSRLQPKLVDFGLAKPVRGGSRITMRGELVGTPAYMSPEQANGDPVDARSDVWSMAVALYELLTGRVPFEGKTLFDSLRALREDSPTPIAVAGPIDADLVAIIMKGLEKSPEARWPSMRAFGIAMARWLAAHNETDDVCGTSIRSAWLNPRVATLDPTPPPMRAYRERGRPALVAAFFAVIVLALVLAYVFRRNGLEPAPPSDVVRESSTIAVQPSLTSAAPHATASASPVPIPRPVKIPPPPSAKSDVF